MHGLKIDANAVEAASLIGIAQCSIELTHAHSIGCATSDWGPSLRGAGADAFALMRAFHLAAATFSGQRPENPTSTMPRAPWTLSEENSEDRHRRKAAKMGDTLIPDLLPGQWGWIPKAWIGAQLQLAPG